MNHRTCSGRIQSEANAHIMLTPPIPRHTPSSRSATGRTQLIFHSPITGFEGGGGAKRLCAQDDCEIYARAMPGIQKRAPHRQYHTASTPSTPHLSAWSPPSKSLHATHTLENPPLLPTGNVRVNVGVGNHALHKKIILHRQHTCISARIAPPRQGTQRGHSASLTLIVRRSRGFSKPAWQLAYHARFKSSQAKNTLSLLLLLQQNRLQRVLQCCNVAE